MQRAYGKFKTKINENKRHPGYLTGGFVTADNHECNLTFRARAEPSGANVNHQVKRSLRSPLIYQGELSQEGNSMVSDFALCTLTEIKKWLNITSSDATRDEFIEDLIEDTSSDMERYCHREFVGRFRTEYYDGDASRSLILDHRPLNYIATLIEDAERVWDNADDVIERDDYMIDANRGRIVLYDEEGKFNLPDGGQNIKIEYHAGYSLLTINLNQNDWLDFTFGTVSTSCQVSRDEYGSYALASQIKTSMNQVASGTYCDCDFNGKTNKFSFGVATTGIQTLTIDFTSGAHSAYSIATTLGFVKNDLSGATKYVCATPAEPRVPKDLKRSCIRLVAQEFNQSNYGEGRQGIKSERMGDYNYTFDDVIKLDSRLKSTLDRYRSLSKTVG